MSPELANQQLRDSLHATLPDILGTGKIATLCGVVPRTAAKWIDENRVRSHRLPGSRKRRVLKRDFIEFVLAYDMGPIILLNAEKE